MQLTITSGDTEEINKARGFVEGVEEENMVSVRITGNEQKLWQEDVSNANCEHLGLRGGEGRGGEGRGRREALESLAVYCYSEPCSIFVCKMINTKSTVESFS